jgi:hypothetical protein
MIPQSSTELHDYSPPNLANLPSPPKFTFRPATPRDMRALQRELRLEGLQIHSAEDLRNAMRAELRNLWSAEVRDAEMLKLNNFWATLDQNSNLPEDDQVKIEPGAWEAFEELSTRIYQASRVLRSMQTDNAEFTLYAPKVALGLFLAGWKGIDAPFRREAGVVSIETLTALEAKLLEMEDAAIKDMVEGIVAPGEAFNSLAIHAQTMLGLTGAEEGKSASPSPSTKSQRLSKKVSPRTAGGKSQAAPPTRPTPAAS